MYLAITLINATRQKALNMDHYFQTKLTNLYKICGNCVSV
ncbi:hypothetical protein HMPREF0519_1676 [Lentilactobacillus hilgardii DSM 20176 = ATCC 8290]|uniref:Uncharacterized protein n=1 Tax=Lentilactobacillus hilgardii (strain ATCC 8290 / DSM 20176 / CCUG 30140 / JCM 1155 / KCTC 3500 / NBRC 15886 / NCIMB 8040 / NRRL B-1843 / 9) TaxID=1423757 RepID=C0XKB5_LENH9|nr:hypothetical protein HMPREF0519_1676 [Lentilactobacillus hilgardii DSM 20176 = ATCC 8290]